MLITDYIMKCTWHLKKRYGVSHKWAIKIANQICKVDQDWQKVMDTPGSIFYPWSYNNSRAFISYLKTILSFELDVEKIKEICKAIEHVHRMSIEGNRLTIEDLSGYLDGEIFYHGASYYASSVYFKDTEELPQDYDIYAPLPRWFSDS